jgi:hypothetical protein
MVLARWCDERRARRCSTQSMRGGSVKQAPLILCFGLLVLVGGFGGASNAGNASGFPAFSLVTMRGCTPAGNLATLEGWR